MGDEKVRKEKSWGGERGVRGVEKEGRRRGGRKRRDGSFGMMAVEMRR